MRKRVLSIILSLTVIMSMISNFQTVLASDDYYYIKYDDVSYDSKYLKNISRLSAGGIIAGEAYEDRVYLFPGKTISTEAVIAPVGRFFLDISGYDAPLDMTIFNRSGITSTWSGQECSSLMNSGIANGFFRLLATDYKEFNPNWNFNYNASEKEVSQDCYTAYAKLDAAVALVVSLIGYDKLAVEKGGFPDGYMKAAKEIGLLNNVDLTQKNDNRITREEFLGILDNAANTPLWLKSNETDIHNVDWKNLKNNYNSPNAELCNGSGRYETLYTLRNCYTVCGTIISVNGDTAVYNISYSGNYNGKTISNKDVEVKIIDNIDSYKNQFTKAMIYVNDNGVAELRYISPITKLSTPNVTSGTNISVGDSPIITWDAVYGAKNYVVWDWTRNKAYEVESGTSVKIAPYTEPGLYAIGVFARPWDDDSDIYYQSDANNFNFTVSSYDGNSFSPTPQQGSKDTDLDGSWNDRLKKLHNQSYENASFYNGIEVFVNGNKVNFDIKPQLINDTTMVPLRAIFEALGATVKWDDATQTVTAYNDTFWVQLTIGGENMCCAQPNASYQEYIHLESPAVVIDGRTLVPVRAISEAFKCNVQWFNDKEMVSIVSYQ